MDPSRGPAISPFDCLHCQKKCSSSRGLKQHVNSAHPNFRPSKKSSASTTIMHNHLNARICDGNGQFLDELLPSQSSGAQSANTDDHYDMENPWSPFTDRLSYDFADYHYVEMKSSARKINRALDMWKATVIKHSATHTCTDSDVPWNKASEMYDTIDSISNGDVSWTTYEFKYSGPKPNNPPDWMNETYELCARNTLTVIEQQLANKDFDGKFDYSPYQQFNSEGDRVYSNLMSGHWAYKEADTICTDSSMHGAMLVPIVAGSDKTTVSVATGHQEYHPVYMSPGNITNTARRGHGDSVVPIAFLPIPKTSKLHRNKPEFMKFCRQLYHQCLEVVFSPLRPYMEKTRVVKCPDGHFRRAVFSLGPYIADYPEQVLLCSVVSNWCPKCDALPANLDDKNSHRRTHEKTDYLISNFDPGILWTDYGIRSDVVPFTHSFPRADIHTLLAPDLLHQLIKGTFKDHLVDWVMQYIRHAHTKERALAIIEDIDHRISAVPPYPGLRRFPDGRDYNQWTGDDSKALMKVFLGVIAGYLPSSMVKCIAKFMDACYIARRNSITSKSLTQFQSCVEQFHELRNIFLHLGVKISISLPRQHSLCHYPRGIHYFASPNGLCSSITESKHIKAVKEPWRRSSRHEPLSQMLVTLSRLGKMSALRRTLSHAGLLSGSTSAHVSHEMSAKSELVAEMDSEPEGELGISDTSDGSSLSDSDQPDSDSEESCSGSKSRLGKNRSKNRSNRNGRQEDDDDGEDCSSVTGNPTDSLSEVRLAATCEPRYPHLLEALANYIDQPTFPDALRRFLYSKVHPEEEVNSNTVIDHNANPLYQGRISVYHSATAVFYAPSDLCGPGGMHRQRIRSSPSFFGHSRRDTVFVLLDESKPGMEGMEIGRVLLFFAFEYRSITYECALINWFVHGDAPDDDTGMWTCELECDSDGVPTTEVIDVNTIARGAHLIPIFGDSRVPDNFSHHDALDSYNSFFVNHYVDHHAHEFISLM
ncbi:hypothetical protein CPC08DRAFT_715543 [Agrocybe pediades]|nr:hypothetical protein CPC08DRAFT_715543 [Agrocybe pediades]